LFAALVVAVAFSQLVGAAAQAQPDQRMARTGPVPAQPARPGTPAQPLKVVAPVFPTGGAGLCQCISDYTRRNTHCLGGAAACQSVCGTTNYSLVPHAAFTCPLAPGEQLTQEQLTQ
jgi:hypothetical protein